MATFPTTNKAPGVYIQEITLPGPLPEASTSITGIVGPAASGPLNTPTELTNIQQFWDTFGSYVEDPYRVYAAHAVNGFFNEGGQICYFVRTGVGKQPTLNLPDGSPQKRTALVVTAQDEGVAGNSIKAQVDPASLAATTASLGKLSGKIASAPSKARVVTTSDKNDATQFHPGDTVLLTLASAGGSPAVSETATIASISSATDPNNAAKSWTKFTTAANLKNDYTGGDMRMADLMPGQTRIRVDSVTNIMPGSYITISQASAAPPPAPPGPGPAPITETLVVRLVDAVNQVLTVSGGLANSYAMDGKSPVNVATVEFKLTIQAPGLPDEVFDNLSMDSRHTRYFDNVVSSVSVDVALPDQPTTSKPPLNMPAKLAATALGTSGMGVAGVDENLNALTTQTYKDSIDTLKKISDLSLLCIPDAVGSHFKAADTQDIQAYMIQHCEKTQDRFAILDSRPLADITKFDDVVNQRQGLNSDNGYAGLYFPWISISNPLASGRILVPPSGHTAGIFANSDQQFGVDRAPANEAVGSALDLEVKLTDDEQGPLNEMGINVIRWFPGQGFRIWGARTIAPHEVTAWRFVNVRRLLLFIEKTIQTGTQFAVFEPNNLTLWQTIKRLVSNFLTEQWKEGALFGDTPDQAFRVRVDENLNTPDTIALGQLIVEVTVRPTTPAEFIIFQVVQDPTGASLQEKA
ncbi:MAG TPA: phage tail sheath subtilisin-like domain-containing protein [Candidatus Solibacter sp.]|nr:phage tail sheath subtilisin-like domain-containing protein [Candidatus Solibacter sp.]